MFKNVSKLEVIIALSASILLIIFLFFNYNKNDQLEGSHDWTGQKIFTTTYMYDTIKELQKIELELLGEQRREGFAIWYPEDMECEIHTLKPSSENDSKRIELLGHEFLHCLIGNYHDEPDEL